MNNNLSNFYFNQSLESKKYRVSVPDKRLEPKPENPDFMAFNIEKPLFFWHNYFLSQFKFYLYLNKFYLYPGFWVRVRLDPNPDPKPRILWIRVTDFNTKITHKNCFKIQC
jgi:hypothetical protein